MSELLKQRFATKQSMSKSEGQDTEDRGDPV